MKSEDASSCSKQQLAEANSAGARAAGTARQTVSEEPRGKKGMQQERERERDNSRCVKKNNS